jgi:ATP adenylyltransferase
MVAPKRHVATLEGMNKAERLEMMDLTALATRLLQKVAKPDGFNIGVNLGEAAGAGLKDHVHMHIVPRWNGDTNFMPVFADVKIIPQALEELRDQLRSALETLGK